MYNPAHRQQALAFLDQHHPDAPGALWAGSLSRGAGTKTSDFDLVVLYPHLDRAWRDTFVIDRVIETFVHDLDSLAFFFAQDAARGVPILATMVSQGVVLRTDGLVGEAKALASAAIARGPEPWTAQDLERERYFLTDARDDLAGETDPQRLRAIGPGLFNRLLAFHRRARGLWTAQAKSVPAFLAAEEPKLAGPYLSAFDTLFAGGDPAQLIALIDQILAPHGGAFYRWHALAPPHRDKT